MPLKPRATSLLPAALQLAASTERLMGPVLYSTWRLKVGTLRLTALK